MSDIGYSPIISIFDTSPEGFFIVRDCAIEYANQVICNMAGKSLIGERVIDLFDKELIESAKKALDETNTFFIDGAQLFNKRCTARIVDTEVGYFVTVTQVKEDSQKTLSSSWSPKDVLEACEEMRSPLTTIFGALNLISKKLPEGTSEKVLDYLAIINHNCYKLLKKTDCIVDFTRSMEQGYEPRCRNYNIAVILRDFTLELKERVKDIEVDLQFECSEECLVVNCDITKIKRVILNIFTSMIKYMETKKNIKIKLSQSGKSVILRFFLDNKAMSQEEILEIFRKYVNKGDEDDVQCGSSLRLIKTIIEAHGGSIFVENDHSEGSIITVMLPKSDKPHYISADPAPYLSDFMLGMAELSDVLPYRAYALTRTNTEDELD